MKRLFQVVDRQTGKPVRGETSEGTSQVIYFSSKGDAKSVRDDANDETKGSGHRFYVAKGPDHKDYG